MQRSRRGQTAVIVSCKSCIIVIYTAHQPMLIITQRHASTTTKRVYERAATVGFTSFADEEPSRTGGIAFALEYSLFPLSFVSTFYFLFLSLTFFLSLSLFYRYDAISRGQLRTVHANVMNYFGAFPTSVSPSVDKLRNIILPHSIQGLSCDMYAARTMGYLPMYM